MPTPQQVQQSLNLVKEKQDRERAEAKHKETNDKLDNLNESIKSLGLKDNINDILDEIKNIKIEVPTVEVKTPDINIPEIKLPDIKVTVPEIKIPEIKVPVCNVTVPEPTVIINNPEEIKVTEPNWLQKITNPIVEAIKNKVIDKFVLPKTANEAIPVRLSNGKKFYEVLSNIGTQIGGAVDTSKIEDRLDISNDLLTEIETSQDTQIQQVTDVTNTNTHTGNKELRTYQENHICIENTTNTPLGANGVFTGQWQYVLNYSEIRISVISNQNSATDGLAIQWSTDGINAISGVEDNFTIMANKGKAFSTPRNWPYFRIVYTNGTVSQGTFNLISQVDRMASKGSSHRIADNIVGDDDAILTKGVVTGLRDDGVFGNALLDNENRLEVSSQPYLYGIAENAIAGHTPLLKFGTRTSIAANTQSLIWEGTNALYTYLTSAEQLKVSSSSAQDGVGGTGILTLTLVGLDGNFNEITETVTMNGITVVTTTASFIRIFRAYGATSGSSSTNVGNITITNNAGTNQLVYIPAGDGQTLMTLWTVPAGKVAYLTQVTASNDSGKGARFSLYTRLNDGGITYPWAIKYRAYLVGGNEVIPFNIPFKIPAKTDIEIRFTTPTAAGVTAGGATFELWFESV